MDPIRKPAPLHSKSLRYLPQPSTPSPLSHGQSKLTTKRSPQPQSHEDIPRPIPPLPLSRTVGFEMRHASPLALRNSSTSISSAASSGRQYTVEASPWHLQSNSSVVTRSSLAYSIVHQNRSSSRSNWDKEGSVGANASCSILTSTPSNTKTTRSRRKHSDKRESFTAAEIVPAPSPSLSRHSATRGSANRPSLFQSVPKPFWLQSLVSSDASEEEPGTGERKVTDCEALLVPSQPQVVEVATQFSDMESIQDDVYRVAKSRRASVCGGGGGGDTQEWKGTDLRQSAMRHSVSPSYSPRASESPLRPKVTRPPSQLRRGSVIQSPCMSPSLTALSVSSSIPQTSNAAEKVTGRRPISPFGTAAESLVSQSPRRSTTKPRLTMKPTVPRQAIDRMASQEVPFTQAAQSPSPSPRRSSVSIPREDWRGSETSSDRLNEIFAQLVDKSQQLRAAQTGLGSSYGSGILTTRTTLCGSPDSLSAAALTARLSDASTTDKTIKTTRGEFRNSEARGDFRESSRANKHLSSRKSVTRLAARSPGPTTASEVLPTGPPLRPAGEPSIIDRVNLTKVAPAAKPVAKRKPQMRNSAPTSGEGSMQPPARVLVELSDTRNPPTGRSQSTRRLRCGDAYVRHPDPQTSAGGSFQAMVKDSANYKVSRYATGGQRINRDRFETEDPSVDSQHMATASRMRRRNGTSNQHLGLQQSVGIDVESEMPPIFT